MPDTDDDLDETTDDEPGNEGNLAALRKKAKNADKAEAESTELRKQVAFLRAGIDPDASKLAKMFYAGYTGDLADVEALKAEAVEIGLLKADTEGDQEPDPKREAEDATRARDQAALQGGKPAGGEPDQGKDPRHGALEKFQADVASGADRDLAAADAFAAVINAAAAGDQRVFFNRDAHMAKAREYDRLAQQPG